MLRQKLISRRGDTIIEVLVALAILGLAFAISYATASHALQASQNSQEHSQALQYLDSQVELARADASDKNLYQTDNEFCMGANDKPVVTSNSSCTPTNGGANYKISIKYTPKEVNGVNQDMFTFTIIWAGLGNLGQQQEQIAYKLHGVSVAGGGSIGSGVVPPPTCPTGTTGTWPACTPLASIRVAVKKILPDSGNRTPSCGKAATGNVAGSAVKLLSGGAGITQTTGADSSTVFNGLTEGKNYAVKATSAPPSYDVCEPSTGTAVASSGTPPTISLEVRPICTAKSTGSWRYIGRYGGGWFLASSLPYSYEFYPYYISYEGSGSYWDFNGTLYEYAYIYMWRWTTSIQRTCPS